MARSYVQTWGASQSHALSACLFQQRICICDHKMLQMGSCLLLWLISILPPLQKHARGAQSLSLPLAVLWRQGTLGLGKGKYWWCWTQTARRLRLPRWMKWKGSWCLIHVSLLFIARFVTQTGQHDLRGGNLQTAFWKPSFSMLQSYASSPAEPCWNLNSWHWLATSQRRFSYIFAEHVLRHRCIYSSLGLLEIHVSTYIFANLQKRTYT